MCQIIHKPKNYSLPFELLTSTCMVNSDGFGAMLFSGGKVYADKAYEGDNDPEKIAKVLETIHDEDAFLHFRFRTKGNVDAESCHPFKIYDDFDREIYLMHNGTFSDFGGADTVDSLEFGQKVVAPLYETFLKSGERHPLTNPLFSLTVEKWAGVGNKVVLLDNMGDYSIINRKSGEEYHDKENDTKLWVSNTYSFNRSHRTGYTTYNTRFNGGSSQNGAPFRTDAHTTTANSSATGGDSKSALGTTTNTARTEIKTGVGKVPQKVERPSYWRDVLGLGSPDELLDMTAEDIRELVDLEPEHACLLIQDLFYERYIDMYDDDISRDEDDEVAEESDVVVN